MAKFLKNKSVGYYIAAFDAVLAIVLAIIFFSTYSGAMANNAAGQVPESIGIFLIAGAVVEIVLLALPQYRFIHIGAVALYCLALMKEVFLIPNLIADKINNVEYQGGNLDTNIVYIVGLFIIILTAIAASFIGFFKDEKVDEAKMAPEKSPLGIGKVALGAVVVIAAVLTSTMMTKNLKNQSNKATTPDAGTNAGNLSSTIDDDEKKEEYDPITDDIKTAAEASEYDFDPTSVIIKQQEEWDFTDSTLASLSYSSTRSDAHLVYVFEGRYSEGYQGQYNEYFAYMYLWDDGLYTGKSNSTTFKGFWYNSSLTETGKDENGDDVKDCLNMVSNVNKYQSIITEECTGFYERSAYIFLNPGWGDGRSMVVSAYYYYPEVALFIDTGESKLNYKVGDRFDRSSWTANRVLKNLKYSSVWLSEEVKWTDQAGMTTGGRFTAAGTYTITAKWNNLEASVDVTVEEAPAAE